MRRLIYLTLVLMTGFIYFGCLGMTAEQRKELYDRRKSAAGSPFVRDTDDLIWRMYSY